MEWTAVTRCSAVQLQRYRCMLAGDPLARMRSVMFWYFCPLTGSTHWGERGEPTQRTVPEYRSLRAPNHEHGDLSETLVISLALVGTWRQMLGLLLLT
jgi:hypothetical protein